MRFVFAFTDEQRYVNKAIILVFFSFFFACRVYFYCLFNGNLRNICYHENGEEGKLGKKVSLNNKLKINCERTVDAIVKPMQYSKIIYQLKSKNKNLNVTKQKLRPTKLGWKVSTGLFFEQITNIYGTSVWWRRKT